MGWPCQMINDSIRLNSKATTTQKKICTQISFYAFCYGLHATWNRECCTVKRQFHENDTINEHITEEMRACGCDGEPAKYIYIYFCRANAHTLSQLTIIINDNERMFHVKSVHVSMAQVQLWLDRIEGKHTQILYLFTLC